MKKGGLSVLYPDPNSGVGGIDNIDRSEQVFDQYDIPETPGKMIIHDFLIVCRQKMFIFVFKGFHKQFYLLQLYYFMKKYALRLLYDDMSYTIDRLKDS